MERKIVIVLVIMLLTMDLFSVSRIEVKAAAKPMIKIENTKKHSIKISWTRIKDDRSYVVYRSTYYSGSYTVVKKTNTLSFTDSNLQEGTAYFYKVKALKGNGKSALISDIKYGYIGSSKIPKLININQRSIKPDQMSVVIVSTRNTTTSYANVSFYTRKSKSTFGLEFSTIGFVGTKGIGKTKEGDGKTPSGNYGFSKAFGISKVPTGTKLPYTQVNATHWVVSDSKSKYYNKFVSTKDVKMDWNKKLGEQLYNYKVPYAYALFMNYNSEGKKGKGSAIFLHCYSTKDYTAGCVAIPKDNMKYLLQKLTMKNKVISSEIIINTYSNLIK